DRLDAGGRRTVIGLVRREAQREALEAEAARDEVARLAVQVARDLAVSERSRDLLEVEVDEVGVEVQSAPDRVRVLEADPAHADAAAERVRGDRSEDVDPLRAGANPQRAV